MKKNYIKPSIKENIGTVAAFPLIMAAASIADVASAAAVGVAAAVANKTGMIIEDRIELSYTEISGLLI